jgi:outer membrane lipoprotein SlyB
METVQSKQLPHPIVIAAAASVVVFCAFGTAAVLGWIPKSGLPTELKDPVANAAPASAPATTPSVAAAPAPVTAPAPAKKEVVVSKPEPRVMARTESRPAARPEPAKVEPQVSALPPPAPMESRRGEPDPTTISSAPPVPASETGRTAPILCRDCGVIEAINETEKNGEGSGLGAVAGGVVGAIAGKQVGGGRGRTAMSVLGAIGGAVAGNQIEKHARSVKNYDITIRFEDGTTRTLSQTTPPSWRTGDRVRLVNGVIQSNA